MLKLHVVYNEKTIINEIRVLFYIIMLNSHWAV